MKKNVLILSTKEYPSYTNLITNSLKESFISYSICAWEDYKKDMLFDDAIDLVMVLNSESVPHIFVCDLEEYVKSGKSFVSVGGPFMSNPLYNYNGKLIDYKKLISKLEKGKCDKKIINNLMTKEDIKGFYKDTWNPDSKAYEGKATFIAYNYDKQCVRYNTNDFFINESFEGDISISKNHNAIGFYLKAIKDTRTVTITLIDKNDFMWKKTICPKTDWEYTLLTTADFRFSGVKDVTKRIKDVPRVIDFSSVQKIQFGHALSHAYSRSGTHTFYLRELSSFDVSDLFPQWAIDIDGVYPLYKFYPITNGKTAKAFDQNVLSKENYYLPSNMHSMSPRQMSTGVNKNRNSRFIPLIEVYDEKDLRSGFLAYMILNLAYGQRKTPYQGSKISAFTTNDESFYENGGADAVAQTIKFLLQDIYLVEGGTDEYMYLTKSCKGYVGAVIAVNKNSNINLDEYSVNIFYNTSNININQDTKVQCSKMEMVFEDEYYTYYKYLNDFISTHTDITVNLLKEDGIIDTLEHSTKVYNQKPVDSLKFAYIKDGENEVYIGDNPVRFFGVNYMPTASVGSTYGDAHEHYVANFSYDPDLVYKDLLRVKEVGINAVSIFITYAPCITSNNIVHLIEMCRDLGLYVDLSLRPHANPFDFNKDEVNELITKYSLNLNDNIISYDIAWERYFGTYNPCYGNFKGRKGYNKEWEDFLIERFGTIENAQEILGYPIPRDDDGNICGVSDDMLRIQDEKYLKLVCAYRYFANNLITKTHMKAREYIKSIDPNHLLSPRTGDASTIPLVDPGIFGYDYKSLSSMDFFSPESYALSDDDKILRQGVFTNVYSRYARPNSVVMWKEFGKSIWTGSNFHDNSISKKFQGDFYRSFFDMLIKGHTSGLFAWWWSGGYRIGENSDFGIVNPDGSDRDVTSVFREYKDKFLNAPKLDYSAENVQYIKFDRDKSVTGLLNVYRSIEDEFFNAIDNGKNVVLIDDGCMQTTKTIPLIGVSDTEYTHRAHKHVDGVITKIYAVMDDGKKTELEMYDTLNVKNSKKVKIIVTAVNVENTAWSNAVDNPNAQGTVVFTNAVNSFYKFKETLSKPVNYLDEVTLEFFINCENKGLLVGGFSVVNRFDFGDQISINITSY